VPVSPITNACNGVANDCSLREAVVRANAAAGADTIILPAGTYTLTRGRIASPAYDAVTGTLNINDSLTIIGAVDGGGNPTSIVTWGALTSGLSVDMIFAVNEDFPAPTAADGTFSNMVIENGVNHGTHSADGDGGCMEYDGGTNGTANLSLTNVIRVAARGWSSSTWLPTAARWAPTEPSPSATASSRTIQRWTIPPRALVAASR
jgi:hypothetical protein